MIVQNRLDRAYPTNHYTRMTNKVVIGIDLDGTLADIHHPWLEKFNATHKTKYVKEDWTDWDCFNPSIENPGDFFKSLLAHLHPDVYEAAPPYPHMAEAINKLASQPDVELVCVTTNPSNRDAEFSVAKLAWLEEHIPALSKGVIFTKVKSGFGLDFLIDDAPHNTAHPADYTPILIERPWNRNVSCEHRIAGWESALDTILPLVAEHATQKSIASGLPAKTITQSQNCGPPIGRNV